MDAAPTEPGRDDLLRDLDRRRGLATAGRDRRHWTDEAGCKGRAELFFPPPSERPAARFRREAAGRRLCQACPVQRECREHARSALEEGLWGGETEAERVAAGFTRRRSQAAPRAGPAPF